MFPLILHMLHPVYAWPSKCSKRESRSGKASWVLDWNPAQYYLLHNSPEQSKSQGQPRFKELQVTERGGGLGPVLHQSLLQLPWAQSWLCFRASWQPRVGYPASWQPRGKGKWDKLSSERQTQQAGWEPWVSPWASWRPGQKGIPNKTDTDSPSRERGFFPPGIKFSEDIRPFSQHWCPH